MPVNKTLLSRAQSAVIARDFELAARLYKELLNDSPDDIELLRQLGNLHVKSGKDEQALPVFERISALVADDVDALISIGGIYRRQKKYEESIAVLERALATGTNSTQVSYNLGFTFRQMGSYDDAISCFEDVVDQNPNDVLAFNHIGAIYAERGEHEEAINTYQRGLKTDPNHPILQMNLAKSYEAIGANSKAVTAYAAALKAKPGWLECIDNYSKLLLKLNRVRDAYDLINGALRLNAEDAKMHTRMGDVYLKQSIFPDAEKEYKEALTYDDEYMPALEGLVDSQEGQGKTEEAVKTIQKIEKIEPNNPIIIQKSASIYLSANYLPAAYEKIMQLMDSSSKDVQTLSLLGQYYISNGEWEQAEETLQKIVALDPTYAEFYRDGAKRFMQAGKTVEAEKYLQKAIAQNPHDAKALTALGSLYEKNNQLDKAYDSYRKASVVDINNNVAKSALMRVRNQNPDLGLYDAPPSMEMQNAEIKDEPPKPVLTQTASAHNSVAAKPDSPFDDEPDIIASVADIPEIEPVQEAEPVEELEPLEAAEEDVAPAVAEEQPNLHQLAQDESMDENLFAEMPTFSDEPVLPNQKKPADDAGTDSAPFETFDPFANPDFEDEIVGDQAIPAQLSEPEEDDALRQDSDEEEDFDVPDALTETLDKISAQVDKATLAAADAWRAARKAADYAQAAEDARHASAETLEEIEALSEELDEVAEILPAHVEEVETTDGDSEISDDDLDELVEVPILELPDETTEVTEGDLDDIDVPILAPADAADIPSLVSANGDDALPKELSSPSILDMVEATDELTQYKASVSLFKTLRALADDLPEQKRDMFKTSCMSETLDAIIAKLEG